MKLWTYRRRFAVADVSVEVESISRASSLETILRVDGRERARDLLDFSREPVRNQRLEADLPQGRLLVEVGYNSWWNVGARATLDGRLTYESHPGRPLEMPAAARRMTESQIGYPSQAEKMAKHKWAVGADVALALLFFAVAKLSDLRTAALVAAGAGLALVVVQRFVKVDLLGGMALFGIVMTLIGAGFAIAFDDDRMIQLRSTILGLIGASFFLADAAAGGRYLGRRLAIYMPGGTDPRRLALGFGLAGLVMALANWLVLSFFSQDIWLTYTTFLDIPLSIALVFWAMNFARARPTPAGGEKAG